MILNVNLSSCMLSAVDAHVGAHLWQHCLRLFTVIFIPIPPCYECLLRGGGG